MNKKEFVKELSFQLNMPISFCNNILNKELSIIKKELLTGNIIVFKNLGKIFVNTRRERVLKLNKKEYLLPQKNETKIKLFKDFKNIVK